MVAADKVMALTILAERLRIMRKKHGYTELDVARRLGISQPSYRRYEHGGGIDSQMLKQLCEMYSMTADYALGLVDSPAERIEEERLPIHERRALAVIRSGKYPRLVQAIFGKELDFIDDIDTPALNSGDE